MNGRLEEESKIINEINNKLEDCPDFVNSWYMNMRASYKKVKTCLTFLKCVMDYLSTIKKPIKDVTVEDLTDDSINAFIISKNTRVNKDGEIISTSDSYKQLLWSSLNSLFTYLVFKKQIEENPMRGIKRSKNHDIDRINRNRISFTKTDFHKLLATTRNGVGSNTAKRRQAKVRNRDIGIVYTLMITGIRCSALVEMNVDQVDFEKGAIYVVDKGDIPREILVSEDYLNVMKELLEEREKIQKEKHIVDDALFINKSGHRITQKGVAELLAKYSTEAFGYAISPHKLRSGYITIMYSNTHDIEFCRRAVGHSSVNITQRYIKPNEDIKEKARDIMATIK